MSPLATIVDELERTDGPFLTATARVAHALPAPWWSASDEDDE